MTIGAAASKTVPLSIDAVEYYNRVIGFPPPADPAATPPVPEYVSPWGVDFVRSEDPDDPGTELAGSEQFVDYSGFTYNRSQTFKGSVTWLDVPTLTWKVSRITDVVPFTNLSGSTIGTGTLTGITAFTQLADDVRALCNFIPDNTFLPGFFMDVPGQDTTVDQLKAIHDPAVDLGTLPENVFQTFPFEMTASLLNPFGGDLIDTAQLRLTLHATTAFAAGDVTAVAKADGQPVAFTVDANGDLVGKWGADSGFPVWPGYNVSTTFTTTVAASAPTGAYTVTLDLVDVDEPTTVLASETGTITVNENVTTVLWGATLPKFVTQGVSMTVPLQVYAPEAGTGELVLTVTGPVEDPATTDSEALAQGDLKVYASDGTDMVPMSLTLDAGGRLVGTWNATLLAGYTPVTWYATVAEGAPVGSYAFGVALTNGNTLAPISVVVFAPESHGEQPPDVGEDTTAPVVTVTPVGDLGSTASFTLAANEDPVDFECLLHHGHGGGNLAVLHVPEDLHRPGAGNVRVLRASDRQGPQRLAGRHVPELDRPCAGHHASCGHRGARGHHDPRCHGRVRDHRGRAGRRLRVPADQGRGRRRLAGLHVSSDVQRPDGGDLRPVGTWDRRGREHLGTRRDGQLDRGPAARHDRSGRHHHPGDARPHLDLRAPGERAGRDLRVPAHEEPQGRPGVGALPGVDEVHRPEAGHLRPQRARDGCGGQRLRRRDPHLVGQQGPGQDEVTITASSG